MTTARRTVTESDKKGQRIIFSDEPFNHSHPIIDWTDFGWTELSTTAVSADDARRCAARSFEHEDAPVIEPALDNMGGVDFWYLRPLILPGDGGRARDSGLLKSITAREKSVAGSSDASVQVTSIHQGKHPARQVWGDFQGEYL